MHYCVTYDISSNRLRLRAARWCKQAGLRRLQRSVFVGESPQRQMQELEANVRAELPPTDRFCIIPLDRQAWEKILLLGKPDTKTLRGHVGKIRYV